MKAGFLSVDEAAHRLECDRSTLYRLVREGKIQHRRVGAGRGRVAFLPEDLAHYRDSCLVKVRGPEAPSAGSTTLKHFRPQRRA